MMKSFEGGAARNLPPQPARKDQDPPSGKREKGSELKNHEAIADWLSRRAVGDSETSVKLDEALDAVYNETFVDSKLPQKDPARYERMKLSVASRLNGALQGASLEVPDVAAMIAQFFLDAETRVPENAGKQERPKRNPKDELRGGLLQQIL